MPTQEEYLAMLDDPNVFSPLYGGTLDASGQRLTNLQGISDFVSSFDPNQNLEDEYTPETMGSIGEQLSKYIGSQTAYNQALQAEQDLNAVPQMTGGWGPNEYGMSSANQAIGTSNITPQQAALSLAGRGPISQSQAQAYMAAYQQTYNQWANVIPAQRTAAQTALDTARTGAVNSFVAPTAMEGLQRNRLTSSLSGIRDAALTGAQGDIYRQAWAAKRGVTEQANRLGFLSGGGRKTANRGVDRTALGAYADVSESARGEMADRLAAFNQSMEQARQETANLESDIRDRGFEALSDAATMGQITGFGRNLQTATSSALEGAQAEMARKMRRDNLFGDVAGMVGGGFGRTLAALGER